MITLYNPNTGTFQPSPGAQVSDSMIYLNILIELRVMNQILLGNASGADAVESLRSDAVNDSANPVI